MILSLLNLTLAHVEGKKAKAKINPVFPQCRLGEIDKSVKSVLEQEHTVTAGDLWEY